MEHFFWAEELKILMEELFHEGHERLPDKLKHKLSLGNEKVTHWILIINCFLKSTYTEHEKNEFLKVCAGGGLEKIDQPPILWLEELRSYMMINLTN